MIDKKAFRALAAASMLGAVWGPALAQEVQQQDVQNGFGASTLSATPAVAPALSIGTIRPANVYTRAQYGSGGAGLRNRVSTAFNVSGVVAPVQAGIVYWAVITNGTPPAADGTVTVTRLSPTPSTSVTVTGTQLGVGASPCWPGSRITVYRAGVRGLVASGNGSYSVSFASGASGLRTGEDPWDGHVVLPLLEGASLVMIGTGSGTVAVFDKGLSGRTFGVGGLTLSYSLALPVKSRVQTTWDNIGADGQVGVSRLHQGDRFGTDLTGETTAINGRAIAGPGSFGNDSDWNGAVAGPLPQLWDDTGHNVSVAAPSGTGSLNVTFTTVPSTARSFDCLTPVANVVGLF